MASHKDYCYSTPQPQEVVQCAPVVQQQSPMQGQYMAVPVYQPVQQGDPRLTARGVPVEQQQGGVYQRERYCGVLSVIIGVFALPCICCCPVDEREVWQSPEGRRVVLNERTF
mmetsp:Transcript_12303/g.23906  ORF Transcript_12303/g.23906 Transcript_12303/m.23906 type:complete len:113 (+) Transcript_12303:191-529(+)